MIKDEETAKGIFNKYNEAYDGDLQGLCLLIADETQKAISGEIVTGYLRMNGG